MFTNAKTRRKEFKLNDILKIMARNIFEDIEETEEKEEIEEDN